MRGPRRPRQLTEDLRRQMVALVDSGRPRAEAMRECDLGKPAPDRWTRRVRACGSTAAADSRAPGGTAPSSSSAGTPGSRWRPTS